MPYFMAMGERGRGLRTCCVEAAVGGDGKGVLGRAAVEGEVDSLDVVTLLKWHGGSAGQKAEGRGEDVEVLHGVCCG